MSTDNRDPFALTRQGEGDAELLALIEEYRKRELAHLHEFVLDLPGRGLGDAKPAAQLNAGDAAFALGEVIHGAKPGTQRHLGRGENRSGDHGCLSSAGGALVKRAGLDEAVLLAAAHRAEEARWPAPAHHRLPALRLCSVKNGKLGLTEALLKLHLISCHCSNPQETAMCSCYVPNFDG